MEKPLAPVERRAKSRRIGKVADDDFDVEAIEIAPVTAGPNQRPHLATSIEESTQDCRTDKSGRSGEKNSHQYPSLETAATPAPPRWRPVES
jgi:hypothetical protein